MRFPDGWQKKYDVSGLPLLIPGARLYYTRDFYVLNKDGTASVSMKLAVIGDPAARPALIAAGALGVQTEAEMPL